MHGTTEVKRTSSAGEFLGRAAVEITNSVLRLTDGAAQEGDFDAFAAHILLPHDVSTFDGFGQIETRESLHRLFNNLRVFYDQIGVTDLLRHTLSAVFRDETTISAVHEVQLVQYGSLLTIDPYQVHSELEFVNGAWGVKRSRYAIPNQAALNAALVNMH